MDRWTPQKYLTAIRAFARADNALRGGSPRLGDSAQYNSYLQYARDRAIERYVSLVDARVVVDEPVTRVAFVTDFARVAIQLIRVSDRAHTLGAVSAPVRALTDVRRQQLTMVLLDDFTAVHRELGFTTNALTSSPVLRWTAADIHDLKTGNPDLKAYDVVTIVRGATDIDASLAAWRDDQARTLRRRSPTD